MCDESEHNTALAERLARVERAAAVNDFDGPSWLWMAVLGILVPLVLLLIGWNYA